VTDNITLFAKWTPVPVNYTVTFKTNGGKEEIKAQTVESGKKATKPADPTKDGNTFAGWFSDKALTKAYDFSTPVTDNITVYAKWTPDSWTVKFDANGGSGSMAEMKVKKGSELTLPENKFTAPANKTFDKWTVGAPGTKIEVNDNLIIKALWKDRTYTVDFYTNGGTKIPSQTVKHGKTASEPDEPTKSGFEFEGWFADSKLTNVFYFGTPITADTTIYVKWSQNPTPDKVTYSFSNNKNGTYTYTKGSGKGITITVKRSEDNDDCFEHFTGVRIDGKALGTNDYIAKSGSTIVTIKATTLEKLATGDHTVTIRFDDGTADAKLKVNKASSATSNRTSNSTANRTSNSMANRTTNSPRTGDENHAGLWIAAVLASALAVCGLVIARKRKSGK